MEHAKLLFNRWFGVFDVFWRRMAIANEYVRRTNGSEITGEIGSHCDGTPVNLHNFLLGLNTGALGAPNIVRASTNNLVLIRGALGAPVTLRNSQILLINCGGALHTYLLVILGSNLRSNPRCSSISTLLLRVSRNGLSFFTCCFFVSTTCCFFDANQSERGHLFFFLPSTFVI